MFSQNFQGAIMVQHGEFFDDLVHLPHKLPNQTLEPIHCIGGNLGGE